MLLIVCGVMLQSFRCHHILGIQFQACWKSKKKNQLPKSFLSSTKVGFRQPEICSDVGDDLSMQVAYDHVFFDDCYYMACDFPLTSFKHCNRETNRVNHELARVATFSRARDWFDHPHKRCNYCFSLIKVSSRPKNTRYKSWGARCQCRLEEVYRLEVGLVGRTSGMLV